MWNQRPSWRARLVPGRFAYRRAARLLGALHARCCRHAASRPGCDGKSTPALAAGCPRAVPAPEPFLALKHKAKRSGGFLGRARTARSNACARSRSPLLHLHVGNHGDAQSGHRGAQQVRTRGVPTPPRAPLALRNPGRYPSRSLSARRVPAGITASPPSVTTPTGCARRTSSTTASRSTIPRVSIILILILLGEALASPARSGVRPCERTAPGWPELSPGSFFSRKHHGGRAVPHPRPHRGDPEEVLGQPLLGRLRETRMHGEDARPASAAFAA